MFLSLGSTYVPIHDAANMAHETEKKLAHCICGHLHPLPMGSKNLREVQAHVTSR